MSKPEMANCVDIVRPFISDVYGFGLEDRVQVVGGIGSAALEHDGTYIVPEARAVIAPAGLRVDQFRRDGTRRDFDMLVNTTEAQ